MTTDAKTLISRSPRQPGTRTVVIRLRHDEVEKADKLASRELRSRSAFIRMMYLRGVKEYERENGLSS